MREHKINTQFSVKVDTKFKCFNESSEFSLLYFSDTNSVIQQNIDALFTEIKHGELKPENNTSILTDAYINDINIAVQENHALNVLDVIKILNEYYIIANISNNILTLNKKLTLDIPAETIVEYSNLSGIYETYISFSVPDVYHIIVRNKKHTKSLISSVKLVTETLDEKLDILAISKNDKTFI